MENKVSTGVTLVFIGLVLLLHSTDVISFNLFALFKYWPLLIILAGINILVKKKPYGNYISVGCNILVLSWLFYVGTTSKQPSWFNNDYVTIDMGNKSAKSEDPPKVVVSQPLDNTKQASLTFNTGEGTFKIKSADDDKLAKAFSGNDNTSLQLEVKDAGDKKEMTLKSRAVNDNKSGSNVEVTLNRSATWDLDLNFGAAKMDADLSDIRFRTLKINNGASKVDVKLGEPTLGTSRVEINAGASKIELRIPKGTAVQLKQESIFSKNDLEGLTTKADGIAESDDYEQATNKIFIELKGAANKVTISRY